MLLEPYYPTMSNQQIEWQHDARGLKFAIVVARFSHCLAGGRPSPCCRFARTSRGSGARGDAEHSLCAGEGAAVGRGAAASSGDPAAGIGGAPGGPATGVAHHRSRAASTLLLEAAEVSRAHCRIDVAGDEVSVTDLNSTNGTFVDNKRLSGTVALPHGTLLRIGGYVMTCEYQTVLQAEAADSTQKGSFAGVTVLRPRRGRAS